MVLDAIHNKIKYEYIQDNGTWWGDSWSSTGSHAVIVVVVVVPVVVGGGAGSRSDSNSGGGGGRKRGRYSCGLVAPSNTKT